MQGQAGRRPTAVDHLGAAIVSGELLPGTVLTREQLRTQFDLPDDLVHEACRVIDALGLIETRHGGHSCVLPRERWNLLHPAVIVWRAGAPDAGAQLRDLLQLRSGIEPLAARLAAGRLNQSQLSTLERLCDELDTAAAQRDTAEFARVDEQFHRIILGNCGNEIVARFESIVAGTMHTMQFTSLSVTAESTPRALELHRRLLTALHDGQGPHPELARRRAERIAGDLLVAVHAEMGWEI